ncbi:histidine kinase [Pseudoxanthomonas gei]|nr:histidine kinase [Pseudoxanthomonas gei]
MNEFLKNAAIEWPTARRRHHRPGTELWWLALYPLAWLLLFQFSNDYWFLPAGLRLAVLWQMRRIAWKWMALLEFAAILALSLWRGAFDAPLALLVTTLAPWLAYAAAVAMFGMRGNSVSTLGGSLPRLLACGALAATANAAVLAAVELIEPGPRVHAGAALFAYAMGDLVGVVILAPALLAVYERLRRGQPSWPDLFAHGLVLLPALVVLLVAQLPIPQPLVYALVLGIFPLSWVGFRFGWRPAALALVMLASLVHALEGLLQVWRPQQLQLLVAASGIGALLLGASIDALRAQGKALLLSLEQLGRRSSDLSNVANRVTSVQEQERRRIGGELHDVLGQDITAIATRLRVFARSTDDQGLRAGLDTISELVNESHHHLREIIEHLYPAVLDRFGLQRALGEGPLAQLARDSGMDYRCEVRGDLALLSNEAATSLYRICQEATSNCARHPECNLLHIDLAIEAGPQRHQLVLRIHDDAGPIQLDPEKTGMGLQHIRDRANALGALYQFDPQHGRPRHWLSMPVEVPPAAL